MNFKKKATLILMSLPFITKAFAEAPTDNADHAGFYQQRERGWFWHEIFPDEKETPLEKKEEPAPAPTPKPDTAKSQDKPTSSQEPMSVKWFQVNLPKAKEMAFNSNDPSDMQRFVYIHRAAVDRSNQFATSYISTTMFDPYLDESLRRPESDIAVNIHKTDQDHRHWDLVDAIGKDSTIIYFYSSTCPYCAKQTPFLIRMAKEHGWKIMPVSLDGGPIPNDDFQQLGPYRVATRDMAEKFDVIATPTLYITNNKGDFFLLSSGLTSLDDLGNRITLVAKREGMISLEQFNAQSQVRELYMTDADMKIDTDKMYKEPKYIVEKMRAHMREMSGSSQKAEGATK